MGMGKKIPSVKSWYIAGIDEEIYGGRNFAGIVRKGAYGKMVQQPSKSAVSAKPLQRACALGALHTLRLFRRLWYKGI